MNGHHQRPPELAGRVMTKFFTDRLADMMELVEMVAFRRLDQRLAGLLLSALALQICLGLSNVLFGLPLAVAVAHNAGGAALLLTLVLVNYHARTALVRVKAPRLARWRFSPRRPAPSPILLKGELP